MIDLEEDLTLALSQACKGKIHISHIDVSRNLRAVCAEVDVAKWLYDYAVKHDCKIIAKAVCSMGNINGVLIELDQAHWLYEDLYRIIQSEIDKKIEGNNTVTSASIFNEVKDRVNTNESEISLIMSILANDRGLLFEGVSGLPRYKYSKGFLYIR